MPAIDTHLDFLPFSVDWEHTESRARVALVVQAALICPPSAVKAHCQTLAVMAPLMGEQGTEGWEANLEWLKLTDEAVSSSAS